jgi:hypothetical protein
MSFNGGSQQPQQSMNAGGGDTHVLHRAALYVILDGRENEHDNSPTALRDGLSFGDDSPFTEIIYLKPVTLREYSENTNHNTLRSDSSHGNDGNNTAENAMVGSVKTKHAAKTVEASVNESQLLKIHDRSDLEKLQKVDFEQNGNIHLWLNENWNFEIVRKLPWIFHNQGLHPFFIEANKNTHWQKDKSALRKLHDKGVTMPIDIMAIVRWKTTENNWFKRLIGRGSKETLEATAAKCLLGLQVLPPYYIHQQNLWELQQMISEGKVMFQTPNTHKFNG